jgi:hypothetical protein
LILNVNNNSYAFGKLFLLTPPVLGGCPCKGKENLLFRAKNLHFFGSQNRGIGAGQGRLVTMPGEEESP